MRLKFRCKKRTDEAGFISVQFIVAVAFSLIILVGFTNILFVIYGRGVMRLSVNEAARAGAIITNDPINRCLEKANESLSNIEKMTSGISSSCQISGNRMVVTAKTTFHKWSPIVPDITVETTASSRIEQAP